MQEAEGFRQDVTVVNLSLANTDWFVRQLRDNPVRPFVPAQAPWIAHLAPASPPPRLHSLTDAELSSLGAQLLPQDYTFRLGRIQQTYKAGTPFYIKDVMILRLMQENFQRRPIYWSTTVGTENWLGLAGYMSEEGLVVKLNIQPPDSGRLAEGLLGVPIDVPRTDSLAWSVYRYAGLEEEDFLRLDPTAAIMSTNLSLPFLALGQAYSLRGDTASSLRNLRMAYRFSPSPELARLIQSESGGSATPESGQTSGPRPR
jgi:hypothetical protein